MACRSRKIEEIARSPWGEVAWYFPGTREQFRLLGRLTVVGAATEDAALQKVGREGHRAPREGENGHAASMRGACPQRARPAAAVGAHLLRQAPGRNHMFPAAVLRSVCV